MNMEAEYSGGLRPFYCAFNMKKTTTYRPHKGSGGLEGTAISLHSPPAPTALAPAVPST